MKKSKKYIWKIREFRCGSTLYSGEVDDAKNPVDAMQKALAIYYQGIYPNRMKLKFIISVEPKE